MKKLVAIILLALMAFTLCACGSASSDTSSDSMDESSKAVSSEAVSDESANESETAKDGYVITVVDDENKPVSNVVLQMCKLGDDGNCTPGNPSDAEGKIVFTLPEDEYKVSVVIMPAGYTYSGDEKEFYFEDGSKELTVTLANAD